MFLAWWDLGKAVCHYLGSRNLFNIDSSFSNLLSRFSTSGRVTVYIDVTKLCVDLSILGGRPPYSHLIICPIISHRLFDGTVTDVYLSIE